MSEDPEERERDDLPADGEGQKERTESAESPAGLDEQPVEVKEQNPPARVHSAEVFKGIGILLLLHLLLIFVPLSYFFIGIVQIIYLVPAVTLAFVLKRVGIGQGLLIGGAVTFLLNAACFGVLIFGS
ncbi:hypothetical protein [Paenibacillus ihumii]|uniref:hypothetical protein n=1 Tax=Paenibacillus ihumii TaxID=687436 RepID=UPI0006D77F6D|nr:hypothetical protein [Paenibacillus ihumii]